jgi:hypothetical protein
MAVRQHEAVALHQPGFAGVVPQVPAPEAHRHVGHAHRRPGWPGVACCTASIARARMALAMRVVSVPVWAGADGAETAMVREFGGGPAILGARPGVPRPR